MDQLPQRKRIRLSPDAYRRPGAFLVTIVTARRAPIFGVCRHGEVLYTDAGRAVQNVLASVPAHHPEITIDAAVVMPDHVHVIVRITRYLPRGLPSVVGSFKAAATKALNLKQGSLWQRSFHDRALRDERALEAARRYVRTNPLRP